MKLDPNRFDRDLERKLDRSSEAEPRREVITSKRGSPYVGYTHCPHCFFARVGVTYQGELRSGRKLYELARHSPGAGMRRNGKPVCAGSGMRLERLADGTWRQAS